MAKKLTFKLKDKEFGFEITKIDRDKLYGWKTVKAFDSEGKECQKIDIDESGTFMIPSGGKALAILDEEGKWVSKSELLAVDKEGKPASLVESSFNAPIELSQKVSYEEYLNHSIDYVYQLSADDDCKQLLEAVKKSKEIYTFIYNYRTDYEGLPAFLMESKDNLFLLAGGKLNFEFLGLEEVAEISQDEEEVEVSDDLDFNMM